MTADDARPNHLSFSIFIFSFQFTTTATKAALRPSAILLPLVNTFSDSTLYERDGPRSSGSAILHWFDAILVAGGGYCVARSVDSKLVAAQLV